MTYAGLVSYFAVDVTKSRVFEGHFCLVIFSRFSRFTSATQHLKTRIKDLSTSNQTDSTVCSCLHSLCGASWVSGSEFTTIMATTTGMLCGLFRFLKPRKPRLKNVNSCMLWSWVRLEVLKSLNHVLRHCVVLLNLENLKR